MRRKKLGKRAIQSGICSHPISWRLLVVVIGILLGFDFYGVSTSCWAQSAEKADFFEQKIRPLLHQHCYECHSADEASGGLLLDRAETTIKGGETGPAVVPGDVAASLLIKAVRYDDPEFSMPPSGRLSDQEIKDLETWVLNGAYDPREGTHPKAIAEMGGPGMSIQDGKSFWSLMPINEPGVPVFDDSWIKTPIDSFVFQALVKAGLSPAPIADRATLIRRLKYDLLGLPPTAEEISQFVNDPRKDAYRRLVDQYLSSEQYGVRWGRHWLDVARYADSNGLDENLAFGNAWRYRDYIVNAFNSDKPYRDFVIEQLAGDLLPDPTRESITATGFLVLGAKVLAEPDREKLEMDTIDEQMDATGKVFLGMTFGCVRCHDHKFDPITQDDYYSLATIFKSTKTFGDSNTGAIKHWNEYLFAQEEEKKAIEEVDQKIAALKKDATDFRNKAFGDLRRRVREQAADYLVAATFVDLQMSLREVGEIASDKNLHPRVLHHCRRHLHFHSDDPVFRPWHEMKGAGHAGKVDAFYRERFQLALSFDPQAEDEGAEVDKEAEFSLRSYHSALMDNSGFLAVPAKPDFALDAESYAEYGRLMEKARIYESDAPDLDSAMSVCDGDVVSELAIHIRGSHRNLGKLVQRRTPEVMKGTAGDLDVKNDQSGRLEFARWMTSGRHPLTARVHVNRIWRWHFGRGIVKTTENFGALGSPATHPELLDWLAFQLMQNEWSVKHLQRMILLSSVYRQSTDHQAAEIAKQSDPTNEWLWKFPMMRLEAEQLHDSILAASGQLDLSLGGKTVPLRNRQFVFNHTSVDHTKYDSLRRAIYLPVIRNNLYTTFEQFDFPDPTMPTGSRAVTTVAPQALLLMNAPMVVNASNHLADQLMKLSLSDRSRIEEAFLRVLAREPVEEEIAAALELLQQINDGSNEDRALAWSVVCQSLLASNELMYIQ